MNWNERLQNDLNEMDKKERENKLIELIKDGENDWSIKNDEEKEKILHINDMYWRELDEMLNEDNVDWEKMYGEDAEAAEDREFMYGNKIEFRNNNKEMLKKIYLKDEIDRFEYVVDNKKLNKLVSKWIK